MTYLITGGCGANGSVLVQELVKRGENPVIFDLSPQTELIGEETAKKVKLVRGDVTDFNQFVDTVKKEEVDHIVHMAWRWTHGLIRENPSLTYKVNLMGTYNVLEAARILDVKKVVFTSTWQLFMRPFEKAMPEDHAKGPPNIYGAGKIAIEKFGESYANNYDLDFIALRSPALYGPGRVKMYGGDPKNYPVRAYATDLLLVNAVNGKSTQIDVSRGEERSQMLYTKDLANAILVASTCKKPEHRVFNVGTDDYLSIREIADRIKGLIPAANIEIVPSTSSEQPLPARGMDYTRLREELGYTPKYTFETALEDYIQCVKANQ